MIELPILFFTKEDSELVTKGLKDEDDVKHFDTRPMYFININCFCADINDSNLTLIYSNSDRFVCALPVLKVKQIIEKVREEKLWKTNNN